MQELKSSVILDLGCLKSVAGTQWINQLVGRWKAQGRWFKVFEEKEVFRFGNGETLTSRYGLMVHCTFAGKDVILNFSVVKGDCPPYFHGQHAHSWVSSLTVVFTRCLQESCKSSSMD